MASRLEQLAAQIVPELADLTIEDRAGRLLRRVLTSEIAKRRVGPERLERSVTLTCSACGASYERARARCADLG